MPFRGSSACVGCDSEYECRSLCPAGVAAVKDVEIAALKDKVQALETEIKFNVETIPDRVIVREGGGPENWAASLAVSVRKLVKRLEGDKQAKSDSCCSSCNKKFSKQNPNAFSSGLCRCCFSDATGV